jgi:DNA topoisomerase I
MNTLIIAEKPSVANRLASALGGGTEKRKHGEGDISYYEIDSKDGKVYVAAAVGHLFTIKQKGSERGYPVLEIEWAPSYSVGTKSEHTKAYLETLRELAKNCNRFINACDFDLEGTVIGTNIIKYLNGGKTDGNSARMKFSTTTTEDLLDSYKNQTKLDLNNFYAGETRHMLDWLWGINLSRALTYAVHGPSLKNALSIGRVQGPSLAILVKREKEIMKFVPKPFWRLFATIESVQFENVRGDIFEKRTAESAFEHTKAHKGSAVVESAELREQSISPYPPFDLTALQIEASRVLHLDPSITLSIAQSLYEKAYISYPRTSSQKLPPGLGLPRIIQALSKNPAYANLAGRLVQEKRFKPLEGPKTDEAHPAIFPTGVMPSALNAAESRLYEMIVRRFLAVFAEYAVVARAKVVVAMGQEKYAANGSRIMKPGWLEYYIFAKIDERMLPEFRMGSGVKVADVELKSMQTQPPKRFTKAGLISELEKKNLGTKATRASIIDTLFRRRYLEGASNITVTKFGISVYDTLEQNAKMIVDEATTEKLEEDMEKISRGEKSEDEVIAEGKAMLLEALKEFDKNKEQIATAMKKGLHESNVLGKCPKDGGDLVIRRSRFGKQFVACANYPKCTNTYSLPQNALVLPTGSTCEHCKTPFVKIVRKGRRPFEMDLDSNCVTKKDWPSYEKQVERVEKAPEKVEKAEFAEQKKLAKKPRKRAAPKKAAKRVKKTKKESVNDEEKRTDV